MPDLQAYFSHPTRERVLGNRLTHLSSPVWGNLVSMRGSVLHGARYNIRGYFETLYTSLSIP